LGSEPVTVGQAEEPAQAEVGIGCDGSLAGYDLANPLRGNADLSGEAVLRDGHRDEKLFTQQLARRYRYEFLHGRSIVIVGHLNVFGAGGCPAKAARSNALRDY
jgi:hypothetical protein